MPPTPMIHLSGRPPPDAGDRFGIPAHLVREPGRLLSGWLRIWAMMRNGLINTVFIIVCATEGFVFAAVEFSNVGHAPSSSSRHIVLAGVLIAVSCATGVLLLWRRRWPVAVSLLTTLATAVVGLSAAGDIALICAAIRRRGWALIGLAALRLVVIITMASNPLAGTFATGASATTAANWSYSTGTVATVASEWSYVIAAVVGVITNLLIGLWVGTRRQLAAVWRDRALRSEEQQRLQIEGAQLAERNRIAREMHDVVAHKVSLIALQAGGLEMKTGDELARTSAGSIRSTARHALEDLRGVLGALRARESSEIDSLTPQAEASDIPTLVTQSVDAGADVRFRSEVDVSALSDSLGRAAYRIVQESLTNVHKHAPNSEATIYMRKVRVTAPNGHGGRDHLQIIVANGPDIVHEESDSESEPPHSWNASEFRRPLPGSGRGLAGLAERVEVLNGTLSHGPRSGGWHVTALLPWGENQ